MPAFAALLRAVNVGGRNLLPMAALTEVCEGLGLTGVKTLLQSGNVVFRSPGSASPAKKLHDAIEKRFGARPELFLRSSGELRAALAANPFPKEAKADPSHLLVLFFDGAPAAGAAKTLAAWDRGPEQAKLVGDNLYIYFPEGMGRSKLTNAVMERALGHAATGRNFTTVTKLAALCAALEQP
jgi:uncharacterized protein (DUF1697 family)